MTALTSPRGVCAPAEAATPRDKAADLVPWLAGEAGRIEAAGRIPDDVAARLAEADLFRITQPVRFGGLGLGPAEAWEAVFEVARGCPSCAWVAGLCAANVLMLGKFSGAAQADVFLSGRPSIVPMLTGGVASDVAVEPVGGGVRLSGRWRYASGIDVASLVGLLVEVPGLGPTVMLVEREHFSIDHGSWDVLGMRGTGSKTATLAGAFVPEHRFMGWAALQRGERHPDCPNDEPIYGYPLNTVFAMSVLAPTLGVASAAAEEFRTLVLSRVNSGTRARQSEDRIAHVKVAESEATMAMLRRSLLADARDVAAALERGETPDEAERAGIRMRVALSSRIALAEAQTLFAAVGGSLLPRGTRMERLFRDLHAMSSHFLLQPDAIGEAYGRLLLGLELPPGARL